MTTEEQILTNIERVLDARFLDDGQVLVRMIDADYVIPSTAAWILEQKLHALHGNTNTDQITPFKKDKLVGVTEAASILDVHPNTLRGWEKHGVIKGYRVGPRRDRRFRLTDLQTFIKPLS